MKNLKSKLKAFTLFLLLLLCSVYYIPNASSNYPTPTNLKYINDYTNTINNDYKKKIVSIGKELEGKTGAQAVIVVIDSTNNIPIEDYSNKLFRTWGIGKSDQDNGLLILLAINDRQYRVEVGRGLEGTIPDALSNRVMESLAKPSFSQGNYGEGLLNSYSKFCDYIAEEYGVTLEKSLNIELPSETQSTTSKNKNLGFIGIGFLILIFLDLIFNRGRVMSTLLQLLFWNNFFNGGRRGGGGFGGGSGSGGGFGGFGGGSSNGGGSSGNW
ncbi:MULTISPECIES: TPM domain-containing protein [Clostridia]|uniref:TPM domain-containing protein n=1 Tax=Clostridium saudiense TaxID=1414720 RepID=A0ABS2FJL7_9CLOT|nr:MULTISPECIES: TPM domain-containing protein [Clostridiaceae]MBM6820202.1 TPM domain-containing protein [Clostridium saudiense]